MTELLPWQLGCPQCPFPAKATKVELLSEPQSTKVVATSNAALALSCAKKSTPDAPPRLWQATQFMGALRKAAQAVDSKLVKLPVVFAGAPSDPQLAESSSSLAKPQLASRSIVPSETPS